MGESLAAETAAGDDMSLMPPQVREKMIRLQSENKRLSEQVDREISRGRSDTVELNDTIETLRSEKQSLTDKIKDLEAKLAEGGVKEENGEAIQELEEKIKSVEAENASKKERFNSISSELNAAKEKNSEVEALLKQKDEDIKVKPTREFFKHELLGYGNAIPILPRKSPLGDQNSGSQEQQQHRSGRPPRSGRRKRTTDSPPRN